MADDLYHRYSTSAPVTSAHVRTELQHVTDDDVSKSSPIMGGVPEAGVAIGGDGEDQTVVVRVEGHAGEWTKTSEQALRRAVKRVEGVEELVESDGGYSP